MLRSVLGKTIRDLRWPTFWVAAALLIAAFYFTAAYPTYVKTFDLDQLLSKMPAAMKTLIGGSLIDVSSVNGFLNVELFPLILPAVLAGYAIGLGSGLTAGEESRGTIDVLLSYPVRRSTIVLDKVLATGLSVAIGAACLWIGSILGAGAGNSPIDGGDVAAGLLLAVLLAFDFGALAVLLAAGTGNRGATAGLSAAVLVVMYFMNALAPVIPSLDSVKGLSLFYWYLEGNPLRNGLAIGDALVLAAVALALLGLALPTFERRDLSA